MRALSHLFVTRGLIARRFPSHALSAIEDAIEASEKRHCAEVRVAIEASFDWRALWRLRSARERALEVFDELGVAETERRNGVLLYVLLAECTAEIVADRGFDGRVKPPEWQHACTLAIREFALGRWRDGVLRAVEAVTVPLAREFPGSGPGRNQQRNRPTLL
jgi:hypothetical protein